MKNRRGRGKVNYDLSYDELIRRLKIAREDMTGKKFKFKRRYVAPSTGILR